MWGQIFPSIRYGFRYAPTEHRTETLVSLHQHFRALHETRVILPVQCPTYYYCALKPKVLIKLILCGTKKLVEQTVLASVILYLVLLTMESTIFKRVLWDRAHSLARCYERSNIKVGFSVLFLNAVQHHIFFKKPSSSACSWTRVLVKLKY